MFVKYRLCLGVLLPGLLKAHASECLTWFSIYLSLTFCACACVCVCVCCMVDLINYSR